MNQDCIIISDRERSRSKEKQVKNTKIINLEESCFGLEKGDMIGIIYSYQKIIKDGTFGRVILVKDVEKGKFYAVKVNKHSEYDCSVEFNVCKVLENYPRLLNHEGRMHIGRCYAHIQDHGNQYIVMERYGPNLYDILLKQSFTSTHVREIMKQMLLALDYIHEVGYIHTDIKSENIVFRSKEDQHFVKLIDFGNAVVGNKIHKGIINTRSYRAPEVLIGMQWDSKQDIWCLGCVMYELLFGSTPFNVENKDDACHLAQIDQFCGGFPNWMSSSLNFQIKKTKVDGSLNKKIFKNNKTVSDFNKSIIKKMLTIDPRLRPSAKTLLKDLQSDRHQNINIITI